MECLEEVQHSIITLLQLFYKLCCRSCVHAELSHMDDTCDVMAHSLFINSSLLITYVVVAIFLCPSRQQFSDVYLVTNADK